VPLSSASRAQPLRQWCGRASSDPALVRRPPRFNTAVSRTILGRVASGELRPTIRIHRPPRELAFGRQDLASPGYEEAAKAARAAGFPPGRAPRGRAGRRLPRGDDRDRAGLQRPAASEAHLLALRGDVGVDRRVPARSGRRGAGRRGPRRVLPRRLQRQRARRHEASRNRPEDDPGRRARRRCCGRLRRATDRGGPRAGLPRPRARLGSRDVRQRRRRARPRRSSSTRSRRR